MLMTINRTQDYTKASTGMKLVPHNETLNWMETLQLPLDCMRNIQSRIPIGVNPELPEDLCPYIITDKQWLQENVLCLLSNAVKYSSSGSVQIRLSLVDEKELCGSSQCNSAISDPLSIHVDDERSLNSASDRSLLSNGSSMRSVRTIDNWDVLPKRNTRRVSPLTSMKQSSLSTGSVCYLCFEIEDSGIGMSEEAMANLFSPFQQNQRLAGGTGLGLYSLSKRLDALGGYYGVKKREDGKQGSVFWFAIPYKPDSVYADHVVESSSPGGSGKSVMNPFAALRSLVLNQPVLSPSESPSMRYRVASEPKSATIPSNLNPLEPFASRRLKILIVDDSQTIVKMTSLMLQKLGHEVSSLDNGAMLVDMITQEISEPSHNAFHYDLILVDLQMPIMDGLEAMKRIRALEDSSESCSIHQVMIGMSANSDPETIQEALSAGSNGFLSKPFTVSAVNDIISRFVKC